MPATCVPCSEPSGIEGGAHALEPPGGAKERATMILPFVAELDALREAGRVAVAVAGERWPRDVDAVVDDRDADAVAGRGDAAGEPAPDRGRADHGRHPVGLCVVGHGGPHALDAAHAREARQLAARQRDDERVHDRAHARAHAQAGRGPLQPLRGGALLALDLGARQARPEALQIDVPARVAQLRERRALGHRRALQLDDDLGARRTTRARSRAPWPTPAAHRARRGGHALAASHVQPTPILRFASIR